MQCLRTDVVKMTAHAWNVNIAFSQISMLLPCCCKAADDVRRVDDLDG
jgi:hypothetical protein